jgi:hypothetical protein
MGKGSDDSDVVRAYHLRTSQAASKPVVISGFARREIVRWAAVSPSNEIAFLVNEGYGAPFWLGLTGAMENKGDRSFRKIAAPEGTPRELRWSPTGKLTLVCAVSLYQLDLYELEGETWKRVATHRQDEDIGEIIGPQLSFRNDGLPVVVWEDSFPTD